MSLNWKTFELKYDKKESWAFEQLSYLLFCAEFSNPIGLFRYKNQAGIETEPIANGGRYYGFQAKFYQSSISDNKDDIIDSICKAKSKNDHLNEIFFYINQEFSESSSKDKKKPNYQIEIENAAKAIGLTLQWRVPSHFEIQLSVPENKYIYDMFFSLDPCGIDLIDEMSKHNENILDSIQTEISIKNQQIKIDRKSIVESLARAVQEKKNIVISGEGGCGKTAVFKNFYNSHKRDFPICIFKANELNVSNVNDIFYFEHHFTFSQVLSVFEKEAVKIFVIDSAEKIAEFECNDVLSHLIRHLLLNDWQIIFTTRSVYFNDLSFHLKENYSLPFVKIDIPLIRMEELEDIAKEYDIPLPESKKFKERLCNLFYLREYVYHNPFISNKEKYKEFIEVLWKKRIQHNSVTKDNIHLQRESCIIRYAERRCKSGGFYINLDDQPQAALYQLKQDEVLGYDESRNAYFITHDIYEEWSLNKIVTRTFLNSSTVVDFFKNLGDSLSIRRAFRLWLSNQLSEMNDEIEKFIRDILNDGEILNFWKDEILISILLSNYSKIFFDLFEKEIIAEDYRILKRILFLLRIACTEVSCVNKLERLKPKGFGWESSILFVCDNKSTFVAENLNLVLPVLNDWCNTNKNGRVTRLAGLLTLGILDGAYHENYISKATKKDVFSIIFNSAYEIKKELEIILDKVVSNKWTKGCDPYEDFCAEILEKPYKAFELIKAIPQSIIKLCDLFWQKIPSRNDIWGKRDSIENNYGLTDNYEFKYFPSSANQTPIRWLLQIDFYKTLDFIISFTNRAVECYSKSNFGKKDVKQVTLFVNDKEIPQYLNDSLWCAYRGTGSPVVPNILQSIHMALETFLLDVASSDKIKIVQAILFSILIRSKSASLTSVVCSIVLAYPDKFYEVALVLFKTIDFFYFDTCRCSKENQTKSLYSIGYQQDELASVLYRDERIKTCEDKHRDLNLESLLFNYQFRGINGFTEEQNEEFIRRLYRIIDWHKSNSTHNTQTGLLLARIDRRNLKIKISPYDATHYKIECKPKDLSDKLKKASDEVEKRFQDFTKYSALKNWAIRVIHTDFQTSGEKQTKYDENPLLALSETKRLVDELKLGRGKAAIIDSSTPAFACSRLMLEFRENLSEDDKIFCTKIIVGTVFSLFEDDYGYQIDDGVEAAIRAIPTLLSDDLEKFDECTLIMILALLDQNSLGAYKRICDYVIESIHKSNLWEINPEFASAILYKYIKIIPIYNRIVNKKRNECRYGCPIKKLVLQEVAKECLIIKKTPPTDENILTLDFRSLEIVLQLIPPNTNNKKHLEIFEKILPLLFPKLFEDGRSSDEREFSFSLKLLYFKIFAQFLLNREIGEIDIYLKPIVHSINSTKETVMFIKELIFTENRLNRNEQFWHIWETLYPKIKELSKKSRGSYLDELIINYLLAWQYWQEGIKEWHCLKKENLTFLENASKEIGNIPSVLYSITRFLNTIGSNYENEGLEWIFTIVLHNSTLELDDFEIMTLSYMESFVRKFIFTKRQKIRENVTLKKQVITILDFMIERKSIHAYLLREEIL